MITETNTTTGSATDAIPGSDNPTRTANGKFAKGNRGGPGNPFARQTARLRQAMLDAVSPEDIRITIDALKKKAAEGDVPACKLLLSYCVGKPVPPADPDTLDQHELKTIIGNHLDSEVGPLNVLKGMPLDVLMEMFSLILPLLRSDKVKLAKQVLCAPLTEEEIEENKADADAADDDETAAAEDVLANVPEWMREIGSESVDPPVSKRKKTARPKPPASEPEVDAELLRVLLERALAPPTGSSPSGNGVNGKPTPAPAPDPRAKVSNGRKPPSTNGRK